jgi:uncharacterized protein YyaL (SSP411 family)
VGEISRRLGIPEQHVTELLASAKKKMYAARLKRETPYIDKTVYVNWNALCISAYFAAAQALDLKDAGHFALKSLDRILSEAWKDGGLQHVIAYSDSSAPKRGFNVPGMLDDYAYVVIACLDAYEATADLPYYKFGREIAEAMIARFYDETSSGFFDVERTDGAALGALTARRKPFQDAPTPAANPAAIIALLRLHAYTNDASHRDKAEATLEIFAGAAEQYGMFAGTYGIAAAMFAEPHTQVVILESSVDDKLGAELYRAGVANFALNRSVLRIPASNAVGQNLPPPLADTIPNLPAVLEGRTCAVVCREFSCSAPVSNPEELRKLLT